VADFRVFHEEEIEWRAGSRLEKDGKELRIHSRFPLAFVEPGPWFGRARCDPGMRSEAHWHACNEILYIVSGELTVGDQVYHAGDALAIAQGVVYGPLIAGPEGAEFLTIRDRHPKGKFTPDQPT